MKSLEQVYEITLQILRLLEENNNRNRNEIIERIDELIGDREHLIKKIHPPYTEKEYQLGQKIVALNEQIKTKMEYLFEDVKSDLKRLNQQKELNRSYINPYGPIKTTDGMYLDRKQ